MQKFIGLLITITMLISCKHQYKNPHVMIDTTMGEIEAELFPDKAPKTVAAFLSYVDSGYYNKGNFYRVLLNEGMNTTLNTGLIQGGIWQAGSKFHPAGIPHESTKQTGLSHTNGTISLARTSIGTATSEFFICIGDQTQFDYGNSTPADGEGFAAFGTVIKGMDIAREIQLQSAHGEAFDNKIIINNIKRLQ